MKAVILAGGLGTRISEESQLRPKPMNALRDRAQPDSIWIACYVHWTTWR